MTRPSTQPRFLLLSALLLPVLLAPAAFAGSFPVVMGTSWDGISLQDILDAEYGVGAIDVATEYEGYLPGDADPPYWEDSLLDGVLIRELAGFASNNIMGWYVENFVMPLIDGFNDGVIIDGPASDGTPFSLALPGGVTRFGFYLNPNGAGNSTNAPEPEMFFTNRGYNDIGPGGGPTNHLPDDGDPQCLLFNLTSFRGGIPTFVLAWEDLDYGSPLNDVYGPGFTDNDFNDLVVEISAESPVKTQVTSFAGIKALYRD
jgi:hypothetical protein